MDVLSKSQPCFDNPDFGRSQWILAIDDEDDEEDSTTSTSSFGSDGSEMNDLDPWFAAGSRDPIHWNCQSCKSKLTGGPRMWLSAESKNPFGSLAGWVSQGTFRTWERVIERPGWLRYFFCQALCLRRFAITSRESEQESE